MADIVFTASHIKTNTTPKTAIAGETLGAGDVVYIKASDSKAYKADNDGTGTTTVAGIVVSGGATGQWIAYVGSGDVTFTTDALTGAGRPHYLSANAGKIADSPPSTDETLSYLGTSTDSSTLRLAINNTGIVAA